MLRTSVPLIGALGVSGSDVMIPATGGKLHWNYLLALERDLEAISRYVEFAPANYEVYSIELAHLLFAAASEVDVVTKLLCAVLDPSARNGNMDHYRAVVMSNLPIMVVSKVYIPRYGLELTPWDQWSQNQNPLWWRSYNDVKHERNAHFARATLKNALNAMAALLLVAFEYYRRNLAAVPSLPLEPRRATEALDPPTVLLRLPSDHYPDVITAN